MVAAEIKTEKHRRWALNAVRQIQQQVEDEAVLAVGAYLVLRARRLAPERVLIGLDDLDEWRAFRGGGRWGHAVDVVLHEFHDLTTARLVPFLRRGHLVAIVRDQHIGHRIRRHLGLIIDRRRHDCG